MPHPFRFKHFSVEHEVAAQKVSTDSVLLGAWACPDNSPRRILDVGAGCGILALMMAQRFPEASIEAIEIDRETAMECGGNFQKSSWNDRLKIEVKDFNDWKCSEPYDLIICNPPYFTDDTPSPDPQRNMARHESMLNIEELMTKGAHMLSATGEIAVIYPWLSLERLRKAVKLAGLNINKLCKVCSTEGKEPTLVMAMAGKSEKSSIEEIVLRDADGKYNSRYVDITSDFYLFLH